MRKSTARLLAAGLVISLGVLAAACGGSATPGVASLSGNSANSSHSSGSSGSGTASNSTTKHSFVAFSKCMRKHGVTSFAQSANGGGAAIARGSADKNSPIFRAAMQACQSLLPKPSPAQLEKLEAGALKFSECMRKHGVKTFPDPKFSTSGGGIGIRIGGSKGSLDPSSPTFQAAQKACGHLLGRPRRVKS